MVIGTAAVSGGGVSGGGSGVGGPLAGGIAPGSGTGGIAPGSGTGGIAPGSGTGGIPGTGGAGAGGTSGSGGAPPVTGDEWLMMGANASNTYHNPMETTISAANAAMLTEKWRFTVGGYPPGSAVIAAGKVFVMASSGGSYAIDLQTGMMAWARPEISGTASMAYADGFVYAHNFQPTQLYKLNANDGSIVWGPVTTNPQANCDGMSSPIVAGGKVVVGFSCGIREIGADAAGARGGAAAIDVQTGMVSWTYYTVPMSGEDGAMIWSSVAIDVAGGTVFGATGNNYTTGGANSDSIHAIDLATGMQKWKNQVRTGDVWSLLFATLGQDTDFGANPILGEVNGTKVVAAADKGSAFWMLDRATGNEIWHRENLSPSHNQANGGALMNGAFDGRYFYAVFNDPVGGQTVLHKMDSTNNGMSAWMKTYPTMNWGAPSVANGVLYVPINHELYVLNAETGDELTKFNTGGTIAAGAAAIAQGRVVVKSGLSYALGGAEVMNNNQIICYGLP
jgi:outer membrane protein assembly factor BamB